MIRTWPDDRCINPAQVEMLDVRYYWPVNDFYTDEVKRWGPFGMFRTKTRIDPQYQVLCKLIGDKSAYPWIEISPPMDDEEEAKKLRDDIAGQLWT